MVHFMSTVVTLENNIEQGTIKTGNDPRHDVFHPSDDQSAIAFTLLCGTSDGQYPGRGDSGFPKGGMVSLDSPITVQSKWQRSTLNSRHSISRRMLKISDHRRSYTSHCLETSGVDIVYALLPPKYYQTGHKDWHYYKFDEALSNMSIMFHPNFIRGSPKKVEAMKL